MATPLLSIVIPVYNAEQYAQGCLDSVSESLGLLAPELRERVEVVVSENRSSDGTAEILDRHPLKPRVVRPEAHLPNRTDNWNLGIGAAAGVWRMMLHADDLLVPDGLRRLAEFLATEPTPPIDIVFGQHQMFTDPARPEPPAPHSSRPARISGPTFRRWSLSWGCPFPPFIVFRGSAFDAVDGLDERFELVQDWDLWLRITRTGDLVYLPWAWGMWRSHPYKAGGARRFATEQLQMVGLLSTRHRITNPAVRLIATVKSRSKARWFVPGEDLSSLGDRSLGWQPGPRSALVLLRTCELAARFVNLMFRTAGARAFEKPPLHPPR